MNVQEKKKKIKSLTQFHSIRSDILQSGVDLFLDELRRDDEDVLHAQRILSRQARCRREGIATVSCKDSLIGFQAAGFQN